MLEQISFTMRTDAPYSLNYLVYIQNAFLNVECEKDDMRKFPYVSDPAWNFIHREQFYLVFKELWHEIVQSISEHPANDQLAFKKNKGKLFRKLFENNESGSEGFNQSFKSFNVWWNSPAGLFAIGRAMDNESNKTYHQLSNLLSQTEEKSTKQLDISLVYDEFPLGDVSTFPQYAVVPIQHFLPPYNKEELAQKLAKCF